VSKGVSAASGASDQGVWGVYRCVLSWRFQWDHRRPCPTSAAGDNVDFVKSSFLVVSDQGGFSFRFELRNWLFRGTRNASDKGLMTCARIYRI